MLLVQTTFMAYTLCLRGALWLNMLLLLAAELVLYPFGLSLTGIDHACKFGRISSVWTIA